MTVSTSVARVPEDPEHRVVYDLLTPASQKMLGRLQRKLLQAAAQLAARRYELGVLSAEVEADPDKYGEGALPQLSLLLGLTRTELGRASAVVAAFPRERFDDLLGRSLPGGGIVTYEHFAVLAVLPAAGRRKLVTRLLKEGLSANALAREVSVLRQASPGTAASGRKPKPPSSPLAGLQQIASAAVKLSRAQPVWSASVFDPLMQTPPDRVQPSQTAALDQALDQVDLAIVAMQRVRDRGREVRARLGVVETAAPEGWEAVP